MLIDGWHEGGSFDTLRVAVLCSRRAPALAELLRHPQRGELYDLACVITSEEVLAAREAIEEAGVPVLFHPIRRFHEECGATLGDMDARRAYDALTLRVVQQLDVDVILLLGYLFVVTDVLLRPFPRRVFNIHDSDLTIERADGERRYVGLHSTRDAILAGEPATRSSLHIVTTKLDGGPIVEQSRPYPVAPFALDAAAAGHYDIVKAYAYAHREWMMRDSWAGMAVKAFERMAIGMPEVMTA